LEWRGGAHDGVDLIIRKGECLHGGCASLPKWAIYGAQLVDSTLLIVGRVPLPARGFSYHGGRVAQIGWRNKLLQARL
jgi:hypothetical protein